MGTKRRIVDEIKFDVGLVPQSLASTNATGRYFNMAAHRKAAFVLHHGAMVAAGTAKLEVFQALNRAGGSGVLISGATATSTLLTGSQVGKVVLATFLATGTITINGLVFTAHATTTTKASRQFSISGSDTADGDELVSCINDATYGVPGVFAVNAAGTVSIYAIDDKTVVTLASSPDDATVVKSCVEGEIIVEVDRGAMNVAGGFTWLAAKVTTASATVLCGVGLARFGRYNPTQQVEVSASV